MNPPNPPQENSPTLIRRKLLAIKKMMGLQPQIIVVERPRVPFNIRQGSVQREEEGLLRRLVESGNSIAGPIIEIGTLFGLTTTRIAKWKRQDKELITVDNFAWNPFGLSVDEHKDLTSTILSYVIDTQRVTLEISDKQSFYLRYNNECPSLVFLDAIHTYEETKLDIEWALRVGAKTICGHDYSPEFPGVIQAVDELGGVREVCGSVWELNNPA